MSESQSTSSFKRTLARFLFDVDYVIQYIPSWFKDGMMYFSPGSCFSHAPNLGWHWSTILKDWSNGKQGNFWPKKLQTWENKHMKPEKFAHTPCRVKKLQQLKAQGGVECWLLFWMVFHTQPQETCWLCKHFCFANISTVLTKQWQRARNKRRPGHSGVHQGLLHVLGFPRIHCPCWFISLQKMCKTDLKIGVCRLTRGFQRKIECVWAVRFPWPVAQGSNTSMGSRTFRESSSVKKLDNEHSAIKIANQSLYYYAIIQQSL